MEDKHTKVSPHAGGIKGIVESEEPANSMMIRIREASETDEAYLTHVCLVTADAGVSAEPLHNYDDLPGLVYAVPYVKLPTTFGFVMEVEKTGEVVGYVLGSYDTRLYEREAKAKWWPVLQEKYPLPAEDPGRYEKELKSGDERYIQLLRNMHVAPEANIAFSPAHLHIDIIDKYQRQGWGRKLIGNAIGYLKKKGLDGAWVGLDTRNEGARKFYERLGFKDIDGAPAGNMGLRFEDWCY